MIFIILILVAILVYTIHLKISDFQRGNHFKSIKKNDIAETYYYSAKEYNKFIAFEVVLIIGSLIKFLFY